MEKVMPNVGSATVESVSGTSPKTVKARTKTHSASLSTRASRKRRQKSIKRMPIKTTTGKDDGKKVSDNSKQDADDKKVAAKISSLMKSKRKKIKLRLFGLRFSRSRSRKVKAISETDVKPSVTENQTSDATTVSEVSESDSDQQVGNDSANGHD